MAWIVSSSRRTPQPTYATCIEAPQTPPPMATPRVSAGALLVDEYGRVLLVEPTYKSYWDVPGGYIEPGESSLAACVREVREELGIEPPIGPLLVVDWAQAEKEGDKILFILAGGTPQRRPPRRDPPRRGRTALLRLPRPRQRRLDPHPAPRSPARHRPGRLSLRPDPLHRTRLDTSRSTAELADSGSRTCSHRRPGPPRHCGRRFAPSSAARSRRLSRPLPKQGAQLGLPGRTYAWSVVQP
jgi:ADP-ribose pyrophosphatase YjhB (NUDIX family)